MRSELGLSIVIGLLLGGLAAVSFLSDQKTGSLERRQPVQVSGRALIGGPFTLTDHTGKTVTDKDFLGKYALVFFGYTYCPDVCPAKLNVLSEALDKLGPKADEIAPIFITVDPLRDTREQLAAYMTNFHKNMVGLTGSPDQIKTAAKAYRVYYKRVVDRDDPENYTMDHSTVTYLMDRKGAYVTHFAYGTPVDKIAAKLSGILASAGS